MFLIIALLGFLLGAIPFSLILGKRFGSGDIRLVGDGNPGAVNAWKSSGWRIGLSAGLLDYLKGALPVGIAHFMLGIGGWRLALVALAPILGHAFSPFLGFRGGKAIATTFGVWTGLLMFEGPVVLGICLGIFYFLVEEDAWSVALGMLGLLGWLLARRMDLTLMAIWGGNFLLVLWKHRRELRRGIKPGRRLIKGLGERELRLQ